MNFQVGIQSDCLIAFKCKIISLIATIRNTGTMNSQKLTVVILAGLMIATGALAGGIATPTDVRGQSGNATKGNSVVRDSSTILLDGKTIPANDFIHLYDSTPYKIMNGHIASKLPCDANSVATLKYSLDRLQMSNLRETEL